MSLLSRSEFTRQVFERDDHECVICGAPAKDAHHIIDRSLWLDDFEKYGHFRDNGVSVCAAHHLLAERNLIPPQAFRRLLDLPTIRPTAFRHDCDYSKWGHPFSMPPRDIIKYPSTSYLDISPSGPADNEIIVTKSFADVPVVITIKMDGSNVVLRHDSMGARNGSTANHRSFDALKGIHAAIRYEIPEGIEIFGEWLYAKHSIHYTGPLALKSYLQIFAAYDMKWRVWLSWDDTAQLAEAIGYPTVPVLCTAIYSEWQALDCVTRLGTEVIECGHEGIVIRSANPLHYGQAQSLVGKYVRENHVQTDDHWQRGPIVRNELADPA